MVQLTIKGENPHLTSFDNGHHMYRLHRPVYLYKPGVSITKDTQQGAGARQSAGVDTHMHSQVSPQVAMLRPGFVYEELGFRITVSLP